MSGGHKGVVVAHNCKGVVAKCSTRSDACKPHLVMKDSLVLRVAHLAQIG